MNDLKNITVCFTGHRRDIHKNIESKLDEIITVLCEDGFTYFGVGGAKGFDFLAAKSVLKAKETYKNIKLIVIVPCKDYYDSWQAEEKAEYFEILKHADKVKVLYDHYFKGCMLARNRHLVDSSSVCVYYKYVNSGGTAFTVNYATKKKLTTISVI